MYDLTIKQMKIITLKKKLMLFFPCRKENLDLLQGFDTYKEHYESMKYSIDANCSLYEHHVEELDQARTMAETDLDVFDEIAPGTEQVEEKQLKKKSLDQMNLFILIQIE